MVSASAGLGQAPSSAVAERTFSMDELQAIAQEQKRLGHDQRWVLNNTALKFFRWELEDPEGVPIDPDIVVECPLDGLKTIGVVQHDPKGAMLQLYSTRGRGAYTELERGAVPLCLAGRRQGGDGAGRAWRQGAHFRLHA